MRGANARPGPAPARTRTTILPEFELRRPTFGAELSPGSDPIRTFALEVDLALGVVQFCTFMRYQRVSECYDAHDTKSPGHPPECHQSKLLPRRDPKYDGSLEFAPLSVKDSGPFVGTDIPHRVSNVSESRPRHDVHNKKRDDTNCRNQVSRFYSTSVRHWSPCPSLLVWPAYCKATAGAMSDSPHR